MIFSEPLFLYIFLPVVLIFHFILIKTKFYRLHLFVISVFSLIFYMWFNVENVVIFLSSIVVNYLVGLSLNKNKSLAKIFFGVAFNLALLFYYKYSNLFFPGVFHNIVLPLAISFFTFQQISYLVDVYKGASPEEDFIYYFFYVSFFPQLIAGPIVLYKEIRTQIKNKAIQNLSLNNYKEGITLFVIGFSKKVIIADNLAILVNYAFQTAVDNNTLGSSMALSSAIAFYFQIYFDFSGYTDMARGLGMLFGLRLPINFDSPYKASSISDFWRRWHISLSNFLKNYIYIALGGNRKGKYVQFASLFITMLIGGLWHGASWTFVLWGASHGLLLMLYHGFKPFINKLAVNHKSLVKFLGIITTNSLVLLLWVLFRAETFDRAFKFYRCLFSKNFMWAEFINVVTKIYENCKISQLFVFNYKILNSFGMSLLLVSILVILFGIIFYLNNSQTVVEKTEANTAAAAQQQVNVKLYALVSVLFAIGTMMLIHNLKVEAIVKPFIYFQF